MTKEEFLKDPVLAFWGLGADIPDEWLGSAWSITAFRENVVEEMIRSVSKIGSFRHAANWLQVLPLFASESDLIWIYCRIRDNSGRPEWEWRQEYEQAFSTLVDKLPQSSDRPPDNSGEYRNDGIFY